MKDHKGFVSAYTISLEDKIKIQDLESIQQLHIGSSEIEAQFEMKAIKERGLEDRNMSFVIILNSERRILFSRPT